MNKNEIQKALKICNEDLCHQNIGFKCTRLNKKGIILQLKIEPRHMNIEHCVHGGILSFLLDTAMGFCAYAHLEPNEKILAVDLKVSYLKAALKSMKTLKVSANMVSRTRRLAVSEGKILSPKGEVLSMGMGTYAILKK